VFERATPCPFFMQDRFHPAKTRNSSITFREGMGIAGYYDYEMAPGVTSRKPDVAFRVTREDGAPRARPPDDRLAVSRRAG